MDLTSLPDEFKELVRAQIAEGVAVEAWKKSSRDRAGSGVRARELAAMRRFLSDALPDWESFLRRTIGPIHKKRTR